MSKKENNSKSNQDLKQLFDSDDDIDSMNIIKDSCINYAADFDKWTVHHYYAMKNRNKYPNMFFYYFPRSLFKLSKIDEKDKAKINEYVFQNYEKNLNGKWGYLSLILEDQNIEGQELFNSICNNSSIINFLNSFPLKEDAKPDFDENIKIKVNDILSNKNDLYEQVLSDFENYLKEDKPKHKKYQNFLKNYENKYIYCDRSKLMEDFVKGIIETNKEEVNISINTDINMNQNNIMINNIYLLPENFNELQKKNLNEEEKNNDSSNNSEENKNINKNKRKSKKRLLNKKGIFKNDFDLYLSGDSDYDISSTYDYNNENKINSKSKKIILDDDDYVMDNTDNNNGKLQEISINIDKENKSKKNKKPKNFKRDKSLNSEIIYLDDKEENKENLIKNNFDLIQNSNSKPLQNSINNLNNAYSTNISSNFNLLSSPSNIQEIINNQNNIQNLNKNQIIQKTKINLEKNFFDEQNIDVEFYQNEQNLDGYVSDFTKKVYYPNEIKCISDYDEEFCYKKKSPKKKQKITRIKANKPIIIRQKNDIKNYNDFVVIGIESGYIDKNIEKLKRGLMQKKIKIKKRKNNIKINAILNKLKKQKQFKEEDFSGIKFKGDVKKVLREVKNIEKNRKYKVKDNNFKEQNAKFRVRSKKGNYYDIASKKDFNMDMNIDLEVNEKINDEKEYKNERKFFNCFSNREKEDLNFSDTDSFMSFFKNPKIERKKNKNRKLKINEFYDNSRNQNIMTFFPKTTKETFIKDRQIVISMRKLIDNEKYNELFNFIERDIEQRAKIPNYIKNITIEIFNYSNDINMEKINTCKINDRYEIKLWNNFDNSNKEKQTSEIKENNLIIINNKYDIEKLLPLFQAYLEKLQISLSFLLAESKYNNGNNLNYKDELNNFMELNVVENLMKLIITNINMTQYINFEDYMKLNINFNNSSTKENLKAEFNNYFNKVKSIFQDSFNKILSEIYLTFLRFFISYKPKEIKLMDVKDFCFMSYTFLQIMQALFIKIKQLEDIYKKINNINSLSNDGLNSGILYDITNKYMKILCLLLLNHLFIYSTNDFIGLIIENLKKGNKQTSPPESLILVALFKSISSLYVENNINFFPKNENEEESFIMFDKIFSEYINNEIEIDTGSLGSLNELLIKELRVYLSPNSDNCLSKEKKKLSIIGKIKKAFLYNCFDIDNLIDNDFCIKTMINKKIIINLIQRYLLLLISYFIYYGKNIDCLQYFNDFYNNYNKITDNNNYNSYFDVESISKDIIDNNIKLNLNKRVKGYLVEEYIYSDIQLMNFYDRYWKLSFNNKRDFIINYFNIMCNCKYRSRIIDNIFQKDEIASLINYIFEFKEQKYRDINSDISEEDISMDNNNNNHIYNRNEILKSFDSILIKALYLIFESINKTFESNNNEDDMKNNLKRFISLPNIFTNNISQLNNNNFTLFLIPIISTILIFTQYLLRFKENKNIEITIKKIEGILKFETSGIFIKCFSLSLWINLIRKISEKNININLGNYIAMINGIINQIVGEYHKVQGQVFSMRIYINQNYDNWNSNKEREYFEIIKDYLNSLKNLAIKSPDLLIKYFSILNEIYNILNIKYYYPPMMRIQLLEILNILINHLNNQKIYDNENISFDSYEENFYKFLYEKIIPNIKKVLDSFISTENTNVSNKKKILYPLYEENAILYANIFGILIKNGIMKSHLEYPRYVINHYYSKDNDKNNIFDSAFQSYYSIKNETEKECYIKLPFKLLDIYLKNYSNFLGQIIHDNNFNTIMEYYLELFFIGIFINNKRNNRNNIMDYELQFCKNIFKNIKMNRNLLIIEKEKIIKEYNLKTIITEDKKQKICLINLMLTMIEVNEEENKIGTIEFELLVIGKILNKLCLNFKLDEIDSNILFEIINGQRAKIALNKIEKLTNFSNKYNNKLDSLNESQINIRLHILAKYKEEYIRSQLNNKFTSYIDEFINELTGDQMLSSIVTLNLINSLLTNENSIPKKFENCLQKVYNSLILKASNFCNILSIMDKGGNLKKNFSNTELKELISRYKSIKDPKNIIPEINLVLKENITNKLITDYPLDNSLSSNFFTNLIKYIITINNNNNNMNNKSLDKYYIESIYYYISLSNILNKESDINKIMKSIISLYDKIFENNDYNINYISDIKSLYVFNFFLEKINSFISATMRIEDIENYINDTSSFFLDNLLSKEFIIKTINIIECFCCFMHQYIIFVLKRFSLNLNDKNVHSFISNKIRTKINKNCPYFNNNKNWDDMNDFIDKYLKEKYGKDIMLKGYNIVEKICNNIKIYSRDDEEICQKIDFIKFINFDGVQYLVSNSIFKSNGYFK